MGKIAWILTDEDGGMTLLLEEPRYYSGTLTQIVYFEVK